MTKKIQKDYGRMQGKSQVRKARNRKNIADDFMESGNAVENSLLQYLQEINRIPLMEKEEEEKAALLAAQGNKAAKDKLVKANLRFVIMIAKKYQGKGMPLEDLIGEGNIGLVQAVEHFDIEKGFRLITYAVWWIRQSIIKAIHEKSRAIRLPYNKTTKITRIERTKQIIQKEPGWKADDELREVAAFLDISQKKAEKLLCMGQDVISLDDPVSSYAGSPSIKDYIVDECHKSPADYAINSILRDEVEEALLGLEERDAEIIRSRYGLGETNALTLKEVGDRYNLSRERIRQIEKRALGYLEHCPQRKILESFVAS